MAWGPQSGASLAWGLSNEEGKLPDQFSQGRGVVLGHWLHPFQTRGPCPPGTQMAKSSAGAPMGDSAEELKFPLRNSKGPEALKDPKGSMSLLSKVGTRLRLGLCGSLHAAHSRCQPALTDLKCWNKPYTARGLGALFVAHLPGALDPQSHTTLLLYLLKGQGSAGPGPGPTGHTWLPQPGSNGGSAHGCSDDSQGGSPKPVGL